MHPTDIVSVSELRSKTAQVFKKLDRPQCILINNKPEAMLISIEYYDQIIKTQQWKTVVDFGKK
jgi:PHD/YefM family antitoxin component YafN of YafNO toxin-antitoxin module